jgi:ribosomal protein L24
MERRKFKLGDKVEIRVGQEKGRLGHVVQITSQDSGEESIEVRLLPESIRTARVTPQDLSHVRDT